jgi:hypothetical protein
VRSGGTDLNTVRELLGHSEIDGVPIAELALNEVSPDRSRGSQIGLVAGDRFGDYLNVELR